MLFVKLYTLNMCYILVYQLCTNEGVKQMNMDHDFQQKKENQWSPCKLSNNYLQNLDFYWDRDSLRKDPMKVKMREYQLRIIIVDDIWWAVIFQMRKPSSKRARILTHTPVDFLEHFVKTLFSHHTVRSVKDLTARLTC